MAINKVIFGDDTLMDITDSTVTPSSLVEGVVAYSRSGERITGEAVIPTKYSQLEDDIGYVLSTDSRLSNARTPTAHTHSATEVTYGESLEFTIKKNVYINTNGSEITYNGWDDTDFIDVSGYSKIYCNINNQWNCWYKEDKTFLSNANFTSKTYLDVPSGAKYLRVSGTASAINSLSVSTSAETVASIIDTKADKNEIPDVSNFIKPIFIEAGKNSTTYATGVWSITSPESWDDVVDGQMFIFTIVTSDSNAKNLILVVLKNLFIDTAQLL